MLDCVVRNGVSMLHPFELSRSIDRKLENIYALADRGLSPKAITSRARRWRGQRLHL
jgi:hypothetical protein